MKKFLSDAHTHSTFSFDGKDPLAKMLAVACEKGLDFYGVSEHFDYDVKICASAHSQAMIDEEEYFHEARHLQEDYEGVMNVFIGAEFGYSDDARASTMYASTYEKYRPDFIINSVHGMKGVDYYYKRVFGEKTLRGKEETYREYLGLIRRSLDVPYPYDIVGHIGYITRYAPYEDRRLSLSEFRIEIDDILKTIIAKDKILEVNSANRGGLEIFLPGREILQRYYELGGRKISFGSDAHGADRIADKREELVAILKELGYEYITVPCRGEHIKLEI